MNNAVKKSIVTVGLITTLTSFLGIILGILIGSQLGVKLIDNYEIGGQIGAGIGLVLGSVGVASLLTKKRNSDYSLAFGFLGLALGLLLFAGFMYLWTVVDAQRAVQMAAGVLCILAIGFASSAGTHFSLIQKTK